MVSSMKTRKLKPGSKRRWLLLLASRRGRPQPFFYGVNSTRVFCRAGCRSRLPKPENVVFFNTAAAAAAAGFRACKRCQPAGPSLESELTGRIQAACRTLETAAEPVKLPALARAAGLSPFHFHRLFKRQMGLTPKQYHSAHRHQRFKAELRRQPRVTTAALEAGFNSLSRAYDQVSKRLGMKPRQFQHGGRGQEINFAIQATSLGRLLVAATGKGVCTVELGNRSDDLRNRLKALFPLATLREDPKAIGGYLKSLAKLAEAPGQSISLPLDLRGTAFQMKVWEALQKIPAGQTVTYSHLARTIGCPGAVRAVASACAANPLAIAIPCHRALRKDGQLGGYRWGLNRKRLLLKREMRPTQEIRPESKPAVALERQVL